ncbi:MAG: hypothetical protein K2V38_12160 [Gemmataceae bacterium]|nr:hypothetical protein [Gemmataceae bacterium]
MEELCTLSAGRWGIAISLVEPGTLEHQQGARHAVTIHCDDRPFAGYAITAMRRGDGACLEEHPDDRPDLVDFVLSERDVRSLEFLLTRVHQLVREFGVSASETKRKVPTMPSNEGKETGGWSLPTQGVERPARSSLLSIFSEMRRYHDQCTV